MKVDDLKFLLDDVLRQYKNDKPDVSLLLMDKIRNILVEKLNKLNKY